MEWPIPQLSLDPIGREWLLDFIGPVHFNELSAGKCLKLSDCVAIDDQIAYLALQAQALTDTAHND